jgi:hypothetical protein
MQPRGLLAAVALLAVLGGLAYWSNKKKAGSEGKPPADTTVTKILTLTEGDISKIEVKRAGGESTTLERQTDGTWKITAPEALQADRDAVSGLVSAVAALNADKVVDEKPASVAEFGLEKPQAKIVVTLKGGKTRTLSLGDETPVGGGAFSQVDGDARVFTIASFTKSSLDKKASDLRDKRLLTFDSEKLARVQLDVKGASLEFSKNAQNEWAMLKPKPARADGWQVDELVRHIKDSKLDPALSADQQKDLAKQFASAAPLATASVTDASATQKLEVRKSKDNKYYAKSSVMDGCHLLADDIGKGLEKTPEDFRNKKLFDFGFNDPTRIEYKDAARGRFIQKSGDKWMENNKQMDSVGVQSLIDRLRDISATKFPESGFTKPEIELAVVSKDGKLTEKVSISKAGDKYIARREGEPSLYELDAKAVEDLQKAAADVKEQPAPASPPIVKK